MSSPPVPDGVAHKLPDDLRKALIANRRALDAWKDITPLVRNEFICWVGDAKQEKTRERRIRRTEEEFEEGQRRPCCLYQADGQTSPVGPATAFWILLFAVPWYVKCQSALNQYWASKGAPAAA